MTRRRILSALAGGGLLALGLPSAAHEYYASGFTVIHPWSWPTPAGRTAPLYMRFEDVSEGDRLLGARSEVAERVLLVRDGAAARPLPAFEIPADRPSELAADAAWLQLQGLKVELVGGRSYPLVLQFERSGALTTTFFVEFAR